MSERRSSVDSSKDRIQSVIDAVQEFDLTDSSAWSELDLLSSKTSLDALEVDPAGVLLEGSDRFRGVCNVYLRLEYGSGADSFESSESFLGRFEGHFETDGTPVVESLTVDTAPFYEGESEEA